MSTPGNQHHDDKKSMTENVKEKFEDTKDYLADKTQDAKETVKEGYDQAAHNTEKKMDTGDNHHVIGGPNKFETAWDKSHPEAK